MAVVYHEIYLPIDTESTFDYIVIKQGDAGTHRVRATLISNNRVYTIPTSGVSYYMKFRKPDNNYCLVEATVSDNTISAEVTEEMLRVSGTGRGEFMIVSGSDELKTATFHVKIVRETYTSGDVQSHSDFAPFAALLQGAGAAASNANTAAAAANAAASLAEQKAQAIPDDYSDLVAEVAGKADQSNTYTKDQVDGLIEDVTVETDTTLTVSGAPADAAETGRQLGLINESLGVLIKDKNTEIDATKYVNLSGFYVGGSEPHDIGTSSGVSMMYVPCSPNTTYTINKISSARFMVAYTKETPARWVATYGFKTFGTASSAVFTTGSDAIYLCVYYKHSSDTLDENTIYNSIEIYENGKELNSGIWSAEAKNALLACLERVYWNDPDGRNQYLNVLRTALNASNRRSDLPVAYTQVEYIYGSGTQWATLGIMSQIPFKVKAKVLYTRYDANIFTGDSSAVSNNGSAFRFLAFNDLGAAGDIKDIGVKIGNNGWIYSPGYLMNTVYDIESGVYKSGNDNVAYVQVGENEKIEGVLDNAPTVGYPMHIYKKDGDSWIGRGAYIYSLICYSAGNQKIFDGIPCYRKADNVSGLYDTVTGAFYPSEGTDNFNIGSVVE